MNIENLHKLIDRYEEDLQTIVDDNNEIFKWRAVKCFRDIWFSDTAASMPFARMFNSAIKESSVLIDNSQVSPTNGIVMHWRIEPIRIRTEILGYFSRLVLDLPPASLRTSPTKLSQKSLVQMC